MKVFDGRRLAKKREEKLRERIAKLGSQLGLVVFLLSEDEESRLYVEKKREVAERLGVRFELVFKPLQPIKVNEEGLLQLTKVWRGEVVQLIKEANRREDVGGIMVQLPLERREVEREILEAIDPRKDVDCLTAVNLGLLLAGEPRFLPATVRGIRTILETEGVEVKGKRAVVVGASNIVGKPLALVLSQLGATVTLVRRTEPRLAEVTRQADLLVTAVGRPGLITAKMVKEGAVVIDVGVTRCQGEVCRVFGDVEFEEVKRKASLITPVPGGVGPMTVISLFENLVEATEAS